NVFVSPLRLVLISLLFSLGFGDQLLSEMFGSLQSPNFPDPYPRETDLRWNVSVPDGFQIKLYFSHFDLEPSYLCEYDYVKVEAEGEVLALFCGREDSDTESVPSQQIITSPRNFLSLQFSSDFSNEERFSGFMAHYSAVDVDECSDQRDEDLLCDHFCHNYIGGYYCSCRYGYLLHSDNRTCRVECSGGVFRERSGVLSSVDFPSPYPKSSECSYRIEVDEGFTLRLQFDSNFDVEDHPDVSCPYDYVKIQAGSSEFGPFCGDRSPGTIETDSNVVNVQFNSDNSGENTGWKLMYTAIGSQCPVPEAPPNVLMNPVQSEYFFKDHVLFTCEPGYRLLQISQGFMEISWLTDVLLLCDVGSYRCSENGDWIDSEGRTELPTCLPACGRPSRSLPAQVKRIVGGRSAEPGLFPWQVLLSVEDLSRVPEDRWFGSGALLSDSWVLTAAHVLRSQRRDTSVVPVAPDHVKVFLGLHNSRDKRLATNRSVDQIFLHPDFQPNNYNNDIALLRLSDQVDFNQVVRPVCLPPPLRQDDPPVPLPNSLGVVAGWGISNPNTSSSSSSSSSTLISDPASAADLGMTSDVLQYVKLPVVSQDECQASYTLRSVSYNITDNMFCAGFFEGGRDTCLGDSGGAFVMEDKVSRRWVVFGLVSWGGPEECGSQRVYGVYTRVAKYVETIRKQV
uniref:Mannan-binding lectin serine peptidase 1 n=1 Tax=Amphiprion ocellaris TaxID=80972 RepID=A0AAQ5YIZ7_AMPOC